MEQRVSRNPGSRFGTGNSTPHYRTVVKLTTETSPDPRAGRAERSGQHKGADSEKQAWRGGVFGEAGAEMSPPRRGLRRPLCPGSTRPCPPSLTIWRADRELPARLSVSPGQARARHPIFLIQPRRSAWHTVGALAISLERDVSYSRAGKLGWQQIRRWVWKGGRAEASGVGSREEPPAWSAAASPRFMRALPGGSALPPPAPTPPALTAPPVRGPVTLGGRTVRDLLLWPWCRPGPGQEATPEKGWKASWTQAPALGADAGAAWLARVAVTSVLGFPTCKAGKPTVPAAAGGCQQPLRQG